MKLLPFLIGIMSIIIIISVIWFNTLDTYSINASVDIIYTTGEKQTKTWKIYDEVLYTSGSYYDHGHFYLNDGCLKYFKHSHQKENLNTCGVRSFNNVHKTYILNKD